MREYTYPIDEDGVIWHDGSEIDEPEIYRIFHRTMKRAPDGRIYATCQGERCWVEPVDTVFVVEMVRVEAPPGASPEGGVTGVTLILKGGVEEPLDPAALTVGKENVLYTTVKAGSFSARFTRKAYYELARWIAQKGSGFTLTVGGLSYPIGGEVRG